MLVSVSPAASPPLVAFVPRFTVTACADPSYAAVSAPAPPSNTSAPAPPSNSLALPSPVSRSACLLPRKCSMLMYRTPPLAGLVPRLTVIPAPAPAYVTVSSPSPPSSVSAPPPPINVSFPAPPSSTLAFALPISVSS